MNNPARAPTTKFAVKQALERARHVNWFVHLVATSDKYSDSLQTIENQWSVRQLTHAHLALDVWSEIEKANRPDPSKRPKT